MKARQHTYFLISVIVITLVLLFAHEFLSEPLRKRIFQFPAIDTIGHLSSFFILTWVCHSILKLSFVVYMPTLTFYAALTEVGQSFLGYRNGEVGDVIADIVGILLFVLAKWCYVNLFQGNLFTRHKTSNKKR